MGGYYITNIDIRRGTMKLTKSVLVIAIAAIVLFGFASCNNDTPAPAGTAITEESQFAELEEGEVSVTVHVFKKSDSILNYAIILEFGSKGDIEKSLEESETLKGFVKDIQKSSLVRDNCVLIPLGLEASSMTEIFNK